VLSIKEVVRTIVRLPLRQIQNILVTFSSLTDRQWHDLHILRCLSYCCGKGTI